MSFAKAKRFNYKEPELQPSPADYAITTALKMGCKIPKSARFDKTPPKEFCPSCPRTSSSCCRLRTSTPKSEMEYITEDDWYQLKKKIIELNKSDINRESLRKDSFEENENLKTFNSMSVAHDNNNKSDINRHNVWKMSSGNNERPNVSKSISFNDMKHDRKQFCLSKHDVLIDHDYCSEEPFKTSEESQKSNSNSFECNIDRANPELKQLYWPSHGGLIDHNYRNVRRQLFNDRVEPTSSNSNSFENDSQELYFYVHEEFIDDDFTSVETLDYEEPVERCESEEICSSLERASLSSSKTLEYQELVESCESEEIYRSLERDSLSSSQALDYQELMESCDSEEVYRSLERDSLSSSETLDYQELVDSSESEEMYRSFERDSLSSSETLHEEEQMERCESEEIGSTPKETQLDSKHVNDSLLDMVAVLDDLDSKIKHSKKEIAKLYEWLCKEEIRDECENYIERFCFSKSKTFKEISNVIKRTIQGLRSQLEMHGHFLKINLKERVQNLLADIIETTEKFTAQVNATCCNSTNQLLEDINEILDTARPSELEPGVVDENLAIEDVVTENDGYGDEFDVTLKFEATQKTLELHKSIIDALRRDLSDLKGSFYQI